MPETLRRHFSPIVLAALFALSGGILAFAQNGGSLSVEEQSEVFESTWKLVNEKYYDPKLNGVDWVAVHDRYKPLVENSKSDPEFYAVLKRMLGEMKDAHTRFLTPREANEFRTRQLTSVGIVLDEVEGQTVVVKVVDDSEASRADIKPGMIVRSIDGQTISEKIGLVKASLGESSSERASKVLLYRRLLDGEPDTKVSMGLIDKEGGTIEIALTRRVVSTHPA